MRTFLDFQPPAPLARLASAALNLREAGWTSDMGPKDVVAERVVNRMLRKAAMLDEYFGMTIDENGNLTTLPILLRESRFLNSES
jgi:DNA mismatch repair protein MLH1